MIRFITKVWRLCWAITAVKKTVLSIVPTENEAKTYLATPGAEVERPLSQLLTESLGPRF